MKTFILGGFLGTGKTSLILELVDRLTDEFKVAIIENEVGEIGLDGDIIEEKGVKVNEITSGCVCCQLTGNLKRTYDFLKKNFQPDLILIEPTGIAFPSQIKETINQFSSIGPVISLVDALRVKELVNEIKPAKRQLKESDIIALNKIDLINKNEIKEKLDFLKNEFPSKEITKISCKNKNGIEKVVKEIKKEIK